MKYIELRQKLKTNIFSWQDIRIAGLNVYPYQLSKWTKAGYLIKLKNNSYLFADRKEEVIKEHVAFSIYQPSYVSLEWALSEYGLIPEMVYNVTSVSSRATRKYKNELGTFIYRHIKEDLFFGYNKINKDGQVYLLAEPEKALLDYLYFNYHRIKNKADIEELRLNQFNVKKLDRAKIKRYSKLIPKKYNIEKIVELIFN